MKRVTPLYVEEIVITERPKNTKTCIEAVKTDGRMPRM